MENCMNFQDEVTSSVKLCQVCGCRGGLSCGACKLVNYCSKEHQKIDWSLGEHKRLCETKKKITPGNENHNYLLKEFDLVTESEDLDEFNKTENEDENEDDEARRLKDYEEFIQNKNKDAQDDLTNVTDEEFEKYTNHIDDDKDFHEFKKRINIDPEQVIRFDRGGTPLWITNKNQPKSSDIPTCDACKSLRLFEFQVSFFLVRKSKENIMMITILININ